MGPGHISLFVYISGLSPGGLNLLKVVGGTIN